VSLPLGIRRSRPPSRRCWPRRPGRGFGLLEAIVATALLAGTGLALFSWVNQSLRQAAMLREREQELRVQLSAQQLIETVNPMAQPSGRIDLEGLSVGWRASPLQAPRRNASPLALEGGAWQVGLYRLEVSAVDRASGVQARFEQWRVGTQRLEAVVVPTQ
jgi:general secretion pathway protein I